MSQVNTSFSKIVPELQLAWDSTSLGLLKECPYKYYLSIVKGYMGSSDNVHLRFGIWYHSALEHYDHLRADGKTHDEALHAVVKKLMLDTCVEATQITCEPLAYGRPIPEGVPTPPLRTGYGCGAIFQISSGEVPDKCPSCGCDRIKVEHGKFPWRSDDNNKTRFTLVRTVVWYLEQFNEHTLKTVILSNGKPAVELSFRFEPGWYSLDGEPYMLCGHLDRVAMLGDDPYIVDRKTTKSTISNNYFKGYSPDNQMSLYTIAGRVCYGFNIKGVIIDAAQVAVNFSRFERGFAPRTVDQQEEWLNNTQMWIDMAEKFARKGQWPQNDKSCSNYGGCQFRDICSKSPQVREAYLSKIDKRVWDPMVPR